jgi:hypothetical protein
MPAGGISPTREPGGNTGSAAIRGCAAADIAVGSAAMSRTSSTCGILMNRL